MLKTLNRRRAEAEARTNRTEVMARTVRFIGDIDEMLDPHATVEGPGPFDCPHDACKACFR